MCAVKTTWDKIEVIGKILIGIVGLIIAIYIQGGQKRISAQISEMKKYELLGNLMVPLFSENLNRRIAATKIINDIDSLFYQDFLKTIHTKGEIDQFLLSEIESSYDELVRKSELNIIGPIPTTEQNQILNDLANIRKTNRLLFVLTQLVDRGKIIVGNRNDISQSNAGNMYVIVVDEVNVIDILHFIDDSYISIKSKKRLTLLFEYSGKKQIWIQLNGAYR